MVVREQELDFLFLSSFHLLNFGRTIHPLAYLAGRVITLLHVGERVNNGVTTSCIQIDCFACLHMHTTYCKYFLTLVLILALTLSVMWEKN